MNIFFKPEKIYYFKELLLFKAKNFKFFFFLSIYNINSILTI